MNVGDLTLLCEAIMQIAPGSESVAVIITFSNREPHLNFLARNPPVSREQIATVLRTALADLEKESSKIDKIIARLGPFNEPLNSSQ